MKRDWLLVGCEAGHDWQFLGGCNAGCGEMCGCSVPVHECSRCGDCDCGDNLDADDIRAQCKAANRWVHIHLPDSSNGIAPAFIYERTSERN